MRGARFVGHVWLAASVAGLLWVSSIFGAGPGAVAQQSTDSISQQALTNLLNQLEAQGQVADTGAVKILLSKIVENQSYLNSLNHQLTTDQSTQQVLQVQLAGDSNALVSLVSTAYVDGNGAAKVAEALASPDMTQFFDNSTLPDSIASQVGQLVASIEHDQQSLTKADDQLLADESSAEAVEQRLGVESNELMGDLTHPSATVSTGDWAFAFGTCTYWAAGQWRANGWNVNWGGDAYQWWPDAAAAGHAEGRTPVVGAIVVWPPGAGGASDLGHVAYVTAVSVPGAGYPNNFEISEMNFYGAPGGGFDRVDYRVIPDVGSGFDGFIYPPSAAA
ncbi:MAG TPA: CHAP domain-containing protein [Candidatus Saccharimonadales bacterium]|nr:CHAP domain-containing protein [Candidatus Saccharimonadales bacterium]